MARVDEFPDYVAIAFGTPHALRHQVLADAQLSRKNRLAIVRFQGCHITEIAAKLGPNPMTWALIVDARCLQRKQG